MEIRDSRNGGRIAVNDLDDDDARLERAPVANTLLAAAVAGLGAFIFGYSLGFTGPTGTSMKVLDGCVLGPTIDCVSGKAPFEATIETLDDGSVVLSSAAADIFSSILNIGAMFGAILGGVLCDRIGRKNSVLVGALVSAPMWLWLAQTAQDVYIIVCRVFLGLGCGIISVTVPMYLSEIAPSHLRGALGAVNQFGVTIGILATNIVGIAVVKSRETIIACANPILDGGTGKLWLSGKETDGLCDDVATGWTCPAPAGGVGVCQGDIPNWRALAWVAFAVCVALVAAMSAMPESPAFLVKKKEAAAAKAALLWLRGGSAAHAAAEVKALQKAEAPLPSDAMTNPLLGDDTGPARKSEEKKPSIYAQLTAPDVRRPMAMGMAIMFFQQLSGINAVIFYSGSILQTAGMENSTLGGLYINTAQVVFTGVSIFLMDVAGRRVLAGASSAGMGASLVALALFYFNNKEPSWLAVISLVMFIISFSIGMGPVPWTLMGELFPAHVRESACTVATLTNWTLAFAVTYGFPVLQEALQPAGSFLFFAAVCAASAFFALTVLPETKGKTFEEIAKDFKAASGR